MTALPRPTVLQRLHGVLRRVPTWTVYIAGLIPALVYLYWGFAGRLGADPSRTLEHGLGLWALRFLIAGLAVTPLRQVTGLNLVRFRRVIGLVAFTYVVLHFLTYVGLDRQFEWFAILKDVTRRWYIIIGFASFLFLIPLAITSTNAMIRRLGPKAWTRLHRLVYVVVLGGAVHFLMSVKAWPPEPLIYLAIACSLVGWRLVAPR
ncbi:MAG: protein-methionine-sulfoxide reductase heme-binding subunit MsrQ [Alphaproteobacteria bacterium]|nr:protein-methionine-sulfoxide reductase heme-binding subunit MsrQ [Alphaproteobacteria bacterium]